MGDGAGHYLAFKGFNRTLREEGKGMRSLKVLVMFIGILSFANGIHKHWCCIQGEWAGVAGPCGT